MGADLSKICSVFLLLATLNSCGGGSEDSSNSFNQTQTDTDTIAPTETTLLAPNVNDLNNQVIALNTPFGELVFMNNGGSSITACTANSLPEGIILSVTTDGDSCELTGTPTQQQPPNTYTITITNAAGSDSATVSIAVVAPDDLDDELLTIIEEQGLTGDASTGRDLPSIESPLAQLGKALFFAKNLGGQQDTACASCHHPSLGGTDQLSLPVGVDAVNLQGNADPNLVGLGRFHNSSFPIIGRNSPTVFNTGLWDSGLFWDSRVQSVDLLDATEGARGTDAGIATPDSEDPFTADINLPNGASLANAQSRFPVTSDHEMRGTFNPVEDNQTLRASLADRLDDDNLGWQALFQDAFGDGTISFDRVAEAIAAYEESMVFIDSPWKAYVEGNLNALTDDQKEGAILFFTENQDGGANCFECHSGDFFSDEDHHVVGFPQIGPGNHSGPTGDNDFGRELITGDQGDRFHFRAPSLLNVAVTAPYGHTGAYQSLDQVLDHYDNPDNEVEDFFGVGNLNDANFDGSGDYCELPQVEGIMTKTGQNCVQVYNDFNPNAIENSDDMVDFSDSNNANSPLENINLGNQEKNDIEAFLEALTDPCVENRACLDPWIIDVSDQANYPDTFPLIGADEDGVDL